MGMGTIIIHVPKRCSQWFRISTEVKKAPAAEAPLTKTVKVIASKCGSNHRQAAKELKNEMKRQMLNRRGDLLTSQVWKNIVGFVTDDKGGQGGDGGAAHLAARHDDGAHEVPANAEAGVGSRRRQDASQDRKAGQYWLSAKKKGRPSVREWRPKGFRI